MLECHHWVMILGVVGPVVGWFACLCVKGSMKWGYLSAARVCRYAATHPEAMKLDKEELCLELADSFEQKAWECF